MPQEHKLTLLDKWFLDEHRLDPVTKSEFFRGDSVVVCAHCKTVSLRDSWDSIGGFCANCQGDTRLVFPFFSRGLLRPSASGSKNFKIVQGRAFPSIRIPALFVSAFPSAKLCLYAGVCSVVIFLGTCGLTYASLSEISESDALTETISEAFVVRHQQYLDFTHDWIGTRVSQIAAHKMDAFQSRLSGVNEKPETLLDAAEGSWGKLSSLTDKADMPLEKLPTLINQLPSLEKEPPAQTEQTAERENGAEFSGFAALSDGELS